MAFVRITWLSGLFNHLRFYNFRRLFDASSADALNEISNYHHGCTLDG
jgi:hypothetical protein